MSAKHLVQRIQSFWWEKRLNVNTSGYVAATSEWGLHYTPLPYSVIKAVIDRLELGEKDTFVDIGCGKGRVLCYAAQKRLMSVVGIEINEVLAKVAQENANNLRGRNAAIQVLAIPAEQYDYNEATSLYLYNPFDRPIMDLVFKRLTDSYQRFARPVRIAYANCLHEDVLVNTGWLKKEEEWPSSKFPAFGCPISFWSSAEHRQIA
jgi:SAM-dependent methyltransferase